MRLDVVQKDLRSFGILLIELPEGLLQSVQPMLPQMQTVIVQRKKPGTFSPTKGFVFILSVGALPFLLRLSGLFPA